MLGRFSRRFLSKGEKVPEMSVMLVTGSNGNYNFDLKAPVQSGEFFKNKKVILVGFPGAFTPVCTGTHLPGYIKYHEEIKKKGAEVVALAVNDPYVMQAYGKHLGGDITYLADGNGEFTEALDGGLDMRHKFLGFRTRRFAVIVDNGEITEVHDETGEDLSDISTVETLMKSLG